MMDLRALVETPDADLLREMIGFAAERLMELEVGQLTGAGYDKKSPQRLAQRNGYSCCGVGRPSRRSTPSSSPSWDPEAVCPEPHSPS
jgi:hypothetical protein